MPATSAKQKRFMDAAAHNPAFAKKAGVPVKVAKEYSEASKGQTFKQGGEMKESKAMMKKEVDFMKKKGAPKSMIKHEMAEAKMKKFGNGGMNTVSGFPDKGAPPMPVKPAPAMPVKPAPAMPGKPTVTGAPSRSTLSRPTSISNKRPTPMPSRPMAGGPTAPVNMDKLNQVKSMVTGRPSTAPASTGSMPMKKGGRIAAKGEHAVQKQSKRGAEMIKMARGGGIEIRGKTKGKMLARGGKTC